MVRASLGILATRGNNCYHLTDERRGVAPSASIFTLPTNESCMSLEEFGAHLRKQREQRKLTLTNISEATRINVRFLEAIERGKVSALPQAYIRAFIRAYAWAIDADPEEVIRQYDETHQENQASAAHQVARSKQEPVGPVDKRKPVDLSHPRFLSRDISLATLAVVVIAAVIYFSNSGSDLSAQRDPLEVPFDKVVQESEAALVKPESVTTPPIIAAAMLEDSLRLEMTTLDSVWMMIVIDKTRKGEYLFPPNRKRSWVGKDQFVISMGNAGNATFKLNGKDLGLLGRRGTVVREVVVTDEGIRRIE